MATFLIGFTLTISTKYFRTIGNIPFAITLKVVSFAMLHPPYYYRPHSSLDYLTPAEFARRYYEENQVKGVKQPVEKAGS